MDKLSNNKYKKITKMLIFTGILFGIIFSYQIFKSAMMKKYMKTAGQPPVTISAEKIATSEWQTRLQSSGSLRAVNGVNVSSEIAGLVRSIHFKSGQFINKDDLLLKLNDDVEIAQLNALLAQSEIAKITYERDKAQFQVHAISQQTLDNDEANLKNLRAQVEQQKAIIARKIIRAPFAGKLGISQVNLGQYLQPGDKIVTLQSLDPIYADFFIPQQHIPRVKVNQNITLRTDTYPDVVFKGRITSINPVIDPQTLNVQIEATLSNSQYQLLPGMFGSIEMIIGEPQLRLTLPQTAITFNPYGEVAFTIQEKGKDKEGKPILIANQTFVTIAEKRGDQVAVTKGLKEGELVVVSGGHKLKNGSVVIINNSILPSNKPHPTVSDE